MKITDTTTLKIIQSDDYNMIFHKTDGFTARCGKTKEDDPQFCEFGPELLDMEISTVVPDNFNFNNVSSKDVIFKNGSCQGVGCGNFCYKGNKKGNQQVHMTLNKFREILSKLPKTVTQIAFGIISPIESHPEVWKIFEECRKADIVPNVTINQPISDEVTAKLSKLCGAVAVSINKYNREENYNTIQKLIKAGMSQVNIHIVLSEDNTEFIREVMDDIKNDSRLNDMGALVMLRYKDKQHTNNLSPIIKSTFKKLIDYANLIGISYGFDSCSANMYAEAIRGSSREDELLKYVEPCESSLFSLYCNVWGKFFPCSFLEDLDGLDISCYNTFDNLWKSEKLGSFRNKLLSCKRSCPVYGE